MTALTPVLPTNAATDRTQEIGIHKLITLLKRNNKTNDMRFQVTDLYTHIDASRSADLGSSIDRCWSLYCTHPVAVLIYTI